MWYASIISPMCVICPLHLILLDLVIVIESEDKFTYEAIFYNLKICTVSKKSLNILLHIISS